MLCVIMTMTYNTLLHVYKYEYLKTIV